ncbi:MAG: peptide deformylase [Methylococcales bacterium]|nr:peptide deformylase [Methylococcales bacterium]
MTDLPHIIQLGDARLREIARPIEDFNCAATRRLIADMQNLMQAGNGVGIAAPQLGESWRVVIIASRPTSRYPHAPEMPATVMINPRFEITDASQHKDWEGCLSIPGIRALAPRYRAIKVFYQNPQAEFLQLALDHFPARVFQHEYDHLQGLVYLDRVENNRDIISESEYLKRIAAE